MKIGESKVSCKPYGPRPHPVWPLAAFAAALLLLAGGAAGQSIEQSTGKSQSGGAPKKLSKEDSQKAENLIDLADRAFGAGKRQTALADYSNAEKSAPGDVDIRR